MAIKKNDFSSVKKKFSTSAKYKPQRFFDLGPDFLDAVGLPGPAIGHLNMFLGHSDTGKTTALVKAAVDAQKKQILPVFIITEQKFSFEHAKQMGLETEYIEEVVNGDIHTTNQNLAGLKTRDQAKTFIYALVYGAGDAKIGSVAGGGIKKGKELKQTFFKNLPSLRTLKDKVQKASERGFLKGLDGRKIYVRSQHAALNTLLQGGGAIVMKKAMCILQDLINLNALDAKFVANIHDEWQIEVPEEQADFVGELGVKSIERASEHFKMRCPLTGEYKMSNNEPPVDHNLFDNMTEEQIDRFYKDMEESVDEPSPPIDPSTGLPYNPQYFFKCTEQTASGTKRNSISHECETLHEILGVFEQFLQGSGFSWVEPGSIRWVQDEDDEDSFDNVWNDRLSLTYS